MKLAKIDCLHVAGVPNGSYGFIAPGKSAPNELTLVAGVRGSGKSRLLEAIVALKELVGPYRAAPSSLDLLEPGQREGALGGTFLLSEEERRAAELDAAELTVSFPIVDDDVDVPPVRIPRPVRDLFERFSLSETAGKLEHFPASRVLPPFGEATQAEHERLGRFSSGATKYASLVPSLVALSTADGARALRETSTRGLLLGEDAPDSMVPYRAAMAKLLPELRLRGAEPVRSPLGDVVPTLVFERPGGGVVPVHALSDAQKQAVLLAGTLVRLGLSRSLILLDAPELHVHVADQARFLEALTTIGTDNQWIVATGSGEIMKTARREQVIALPSPHAASR